MGKMVDFEYLGETVATYGLDGSVQSSQEKIVLTLDLDDLVGIKRRHQESSCGHPCIVYHLLLRGQEKPVIVPICAPSVGGMLCAFNPEEIIQPLKAIWKAWRERSLSLSWQDEVEDGLFEEKE